ncbi:MAG: nitronate monooxygenase [Ilumatobacteraceae bacterium]
MFQVSGPDLVVAACRSGVIGAFPTANARSVEQLDEWMGTITGALADLGDAAAPWCPNLIVRQPRLEADLAVLVSHRPELVITSVGSPGAVVGPLHDVGSLVFADVGSLEHARKAVAAGADGLVLLTAGAGGNTGWLNPLAFARAVRQIYDGPLVLAGGISDGVALRAAVALGCDLAYMGTRFIATVESTAGAAYKQMLVDSDADDVMLTTAFTGLRTNMLKPSVIAAGLDPEQIDEQVTAIESERMFGGGADAGGPRRWSDIWSAGHTVSGVGAVLTVADLVEQTVAEYASPPAGAPGAGPGGADRIGP